MVVNLIRGRDAAEALQLLEFTHKAGAPFVKKLIASAVANAKVKRPDIDVDTLYARLAPGAADLDRIRREARAIAARAAEGN